MDTSAGGLLEMLRTGRAETRSQLRLLTGLSRSAVVSRVDALDQALAPASVNAMLG